MLLERQAAGRPVTVGLIGAGKFGTMFAAQVRLTDGMHLLAVADLDGNAENLARPWRRTARGGIYEPHLIRDDPRSEARTAF